MDRPPNDTAFSPWHALSAEEVASKLDSGHGGLVAAAVQGLGLEYGKNRLEEQPPTPGWKVALRQFKSPLIYILLLAAAVTLVLREFVDAGVILAALTLNATIGFLQERKAEKSVRALLQLLTPRARVVRAGHEQEVDSADLVPGDVVLLESGARIPADLRLFSTTGLRVEEALLTGESVPTHKHALPLPGPTQVSDRRNMGFAGTVVASGRGRGYVVEIGARTQLGQIASQVRAEPVSRTPLEERMGRLGQLIGLAVAGSCALGFALGVVMGRPPDQMFLLMVGMAVAAVPEGLPVVLTITLAVGVSRMARRNAIVRRLGSIETLGSTTVIGSDKTGTLTENRMTAQVYWAGGEEVELGGAGARALAENRALYRALLAGVLANEAQLAEDGAAAASSGDPTEVALLVAARRLGLSPAELRMEHRSFAEIPFEPERRYSASIREQDGERQVYVKGAPERIVEMCRCALGKDGEPVALEPAQVLAQAHRLARRGLRILALAVGAPSFVHAGMETAVPEPSGLCLAGLVGLIDPPREGVLEAVEGCRRSGIRVVMITGDHAATALAIAERLGIGRPGEQPLTGVDLEAMDEQSLVRAAEELSVYARVSPEQKLRVVRALQAHGEVVAVTGDGVNDAPALKAADIGVAMGKSGTDVAREAADMVLADDNFVTIYGAVEEGRVVFDNLRKVVFFLLSTGVAAILVILTSLALAWPMPFVPAQLLWLNLVTNGLQDLALAFEPKDPDVLSRPPRRRQEGIISGLLWERTALTSLVMTAGTLLLFFWELQGGDHSRAQTVALTGLVLFQAFQVGNARSETGSIFAKSPFSNPFLLLATSGALVVHFAALHWGPTQFVLRVVPLDDLWTWGRIVLVASSVVVVSELHKLLRSPRHQAPLPRRTGGTLRAQAKS